MKAANCYVKLCFVFAAIGLSLTVVDSTRAATDFSPDANATAPARSIFNVPSQASPLYASSLEKQINFGHASSPIPISTPVPNGDADLTPGQIGTDVLRAPAPEPAMYAVAVSFCALLSLVGVCRFRAG